MDNIRFLRVSGIITLSDDWQFAVFALCHSGAYIAYRYSNDTRVDEPQELCPGGGRIH